ncbi:hypothetical protein NQ314_018870 [Rhamnusium bicolor]|uniref:PiggyBac transposable element-derived protein domain-containing protein n=1 Tax=Rhamnusium bicolor TaxID=1586634 RepID=A0AAV8WQY6_9CUCU|nr:hypothetical protein NQ314_018870 [Rhamnusium bicolor]
MFVLSESTGIAYDFEFYTGKENKVITGEVDCGASSNFVVRLARSISKNVNYKLYFDNYFNGPKLQIFPAKVGILSVGTVRINRVPKIAMVEDKILSKRDRGAFEEKVSAYDNINISLVKWHDNKCVNLLSTYVGSQPTGKVKRWFSSEKMYKEITVPHVVTEYNIHMRGVDLLDSLNGLYRNKLRSKKWTFRILCHFIDMFVVEACFLYRRVALALPQERIPSLCLAEFKIEIAEGFSAVNR